MYVGLARSHLENVPPALAWLHGKKTQRAKMSHAAYRPARLRPIFFMESRRSFPPELVPPPRRRVGLRPPECANKNGTPLLPDSPRVPLRMGKKSLA